MTETAVPAQTDPQPEAQPAGADPEPAEQRARTGLLLAYLRPHWPAMLLGLLLGLVANAAGLATPLVTKWVLDTLGTGGSLARPVTVLLALVVVGAAISLWQWMLMGGIAERVVLDARAGVIRRYFVARIDQLTRRSGGELVTRATSDPGLLHQASGSLVGLINGAVALLGTLVLMGTLDVVLLGITMIAVVAVAVLMGLLLPSIGRAQEAAQESVGRLGGALEGSLRAIRTVKASRAEQRQATLITTHAEDSARHGIHAARRAALVWTTSWTGIQLAVIVILGFGAARAERGLIEVSTLIAFLLYAFQLMGPISELTQNMTAMQAGIAAAGRLREIEAIAVEPGGPAAGTAPAGQAAPGHAARAEPPRSAAVLAFRGVTARYAPGVPPAVRDIDLEIPRVGHTAIVGPSGAGKTTLFSLLLRFLEPERGRLLLDGRAYPDHTPGEIRGRLAYVEQEAPVVPGTIGDNLRFTHPDATDAELWAALRAVDLHDKVVALDLGLDTPLTATTVSGGERQRIALARAVLRTPDVLLLDEATSQVDGLTEAAIARCVRQRAASGAVVTIAHRLSTVLDADQIVVMDRGRIRAVGDHATLLHGDELYRDLVASLRIGTSGTAPAPEVGGRTGSGTLLLPLDRLPQE
ncbi:ABC transporter ATP-binding protein [Micromonospora phaseoli]|uniref:ABC transporter ATP-binding protein n=1 Tax=Micromonospora phaseoli TaxID=1144548 RepID=UPI001A633F4F|nr:ABC transporter ATP-binding protein [Micromonospora phaseoli]GIJ78168.1 putative ABC transporter ATP-binding protein [Micromonospora phaseoli]